MIIVTSISKRLLLNATCRKQKRKSMNVKEVGGENCYLMAGKMELIEKGRTLSNKYEKCQNEINDNGVTMQHTWFPNCARVITIFRCFGYCFVSHHFLYSSGQYINAILKVFNQLMKIDFFLFLHSTKWIQNIENMEYKKTQNSISFITHTLQNNIRLSSKQYKNQRNL